MTTLYITDNGRTLCGDHVGASAKYTGHDISGQPIYPVTPADVAYNDAHGWPEIQCETCGCRASRLHHAHMEG